MTIPTDPWSSWVHLWTPKDQEAVLSVESLPTPAKVDHWALGMDEAELGEVYHGCLPAPGIRARPYPPME